jgi:hypothetical protein
MSFLKFRNLGQKRAKYWERELKAILGFNISVHLIGALRTGLYHGPKERAYSLNIQCPVMFSLLNEIDIRIILHEDQHPHDDEIIQVVESITGTRLTRKCFVTRWHRRVPIAFLYSYEDLGNGLGMEWEVCINKSPYLETSLFWEDIFTHEEIAYQREIRKLLRSTSSNTPSDFTLLKEMQAAEARWRIVASFAMAQWLKLQGTESTYTSPPLNGLPPHIAAPLVGMWLLGQTGISPPDQPSLDLQKRLEEVTLSKLNSYEFPKKPLWVTQAEEIQYLITKG